MVEEGVSIRTEAEQIFFLTIIIIISMIEILNSKTLFSCYFVPGAK